MANNKKDSGYDAFLTQEKLDELHKELEKKLHLSSSSDGLVSLQYTGSGDYKALSINSPLSSILDKSVLERDILDVINYSKNQMSADVTGMMLNFAGSSQDDDNDDDGDNRDVS